MFNLEALEGAGFEKTLTTEEWEQLQDALARRYSRLSKSVATAAQPGGVAVGYVLERGPVQLRTEQNTQEQAPFGVSMTVRYPEIVIIENVEDGRRVAIDASDTDLILALADELSEPKRFGQA